jgi:DNA-binding response OmpR family regulator
VRLTPIEFKLLQVFLEAPERALSREQLLNRIHAFHEVDVVDRTIDVHIGKLREKLADDPARPRYIATVRGIGYKLL